MTRARQIVPLVLACAAGLAVSQDGAPAADVALRACKERQSRKQCQDEETEKACKGKKGDACRDELKEPYKRHHEEIKQHRKQFAAHDEKRDPKGMVDGAYTPYTPPPASASAGSAGRSAADTFVAFRDEDRTLAEAATGDPQAFVARPKFTSDGPAVEDCEEYVYKKWWDWSRYEDATFACKSDLGCGYDVAKARLAHKVLRDSAGKELEPPTSAWESPPPRPKQFPPLAGALPKNAFFALALPPVANGVDPVGEALPSLKPELAELRALLDDGARWYAIEASGGHEAFQDEWAWHDAMRGRTSAQPEELTEELDGRVQKLERLLARIAARSVDAGHGGHASREPLDALGPDPFARLQAFADLELFAARHERGLNAFDGDPAPSGPPSSRAHGAGRVLGGVAMKKGWRPDPQNPRRFLCTAEATPITLTIYGEATRERRETREASGVEECQAWNLLLDEWDRLKGGAGGCLDRAGVGCDWSLARFADRWVTPGHYVHERTHEWNRCQRVRGFVQLKKEDRKDLASFTAALERAEKEYEMWKKIPTVADSRPLSFGDDRHAGATAGDKSKFAAGYEYDAGWELDPIALVKRAGPENGKVCQMSARAWGSFGAEGWLLGHKVMLVEAASWLVSNKWSAEHPLGSRRTEFSAHFELLGVQLFKVPPQGGKRYDFKNPEASGEALVHDAMEFNQAVSGGDGSPGNIQIPDPAASATVLLGPVPVTISGAAGIRYGAKLQPHTHVPEGCEKEIREMGVDLTFKPYVAVGGFVEGGVGIPGCEVGIRADVTLLDLALPVTASLGLKEKRDGKAEIDFGIGVDATLRSLGGKVSLAFDFLVLHELVELFSWKGVGPHKMEVVPTIGGSYPIRELTPYVTAACAKGGSEPICRGAAVRP
jgi:hypothetical protein